ncbi:MAG: TonB-dependent receptor, partial [Pseudomonadota bacterium]
MSTKPTIAFFAGTVRTPRIPTAGARVAAAVAVALATAAATAMPAAAGAAPAAPASSSALEEIVVTARLREETLQEVPGSIAAFDEQTIARARLESLDDLSVQVPSLAASDPFGRNNLSIAMRGIGLAGIGDELPVGLFIDGVYVPGRSSGNLTITDVERIEVARGPQSALYGRNTFAGAINFITRRPGDEFRGFVEASGGTEDRYELRGNVSGPLAAGRLYGQLGVVRRDWGGYYDNAVTGEDLNRQETTAVNGKLRWVASDALELTLSASRTEDDDSQPAAFLVPANVGLTISNGGSLGFFRGSAPDEPPAGAPCCFASDDAGGFQRENTRLALIADWRASPTLSFKSITAWSEEEQVYDQDVDGYTEKLFVFGNVIDRGDRSQEFRLQYADGPVNALAGVFWYEFDNTFLDRGAAQFFLPPAARQPVLARNANSFRSITETEAYAAFGSLGYAFANGWSVTADLRWNRERKTFDYIRQVQTGTPDPRREATWRSWTPRLVVDWQPAEGSLYYASAARGFKTGGFNDQINIFETERVYEPETNWTYEIGTKQTLLDRRLTANLALYYIDWSDQQVSTASARAPSNNTYLANAAESTSQGFELELAARPTDRLSIAAAVALADAEFDSFVDPALAGPDFAFPAGSRPIVAVPGLRLAQLPNGVFGADVSGNQIPRISRWQWAASAEYAAPFDALGAEEWYARADYTYRSTQFSESSNLSETGPMDRVNLRVGLEAASWSLALWVD